jgi:hypothetical protein
VGRLGTRRHHAGGGEVEDHVHVTPLPL